MKVNLPSDLSNMVAKSALTNNVKQLLAGSKPSLLQNLELGEEDIQSIQDYLRSTAGFGQGCRSTARIEGVLGKILELKETVKAFQEFKQTNGHKSSDDLYYLAKNGDENQKTFLAKMLLEKLQADQEPISAMIRLRDLMIDTLIRSSDELAFEFVQGLISLIVQDAEYTAPTVHTQQFANRKIAALRILSDLVRASGHENLIVPTSKLGTAIIECLISVAKGEGGEPELSTSAVTNLGFLIDELAYLVKDSDERMLLKTHIIRNLLQVASGGASEYATEAFHGLGYLTENDRDLQQHHEFLTEITQTLTQLNIQDQ